MKQLVVTNMAFKCICFAGEPPEMDNEEEYEDEEEDLTKDPEEDTYKFLKLLIQSLQQLDRLDETEEVPLSSPKNPVHLISYLIS